MIGRPYKYFRSLRKKVSRSQWMIRLLKQPKSYGTATEPGVVMLQIDGLSYEQFHAAIKNNRLPFLKRLITNGIKSRSTLNGFFAVAWQLVGDDSWRSDGKRPERFALRQRRIEVSGRPEQVLEASK